MLVPNNEWETKYACIIMFDTNDRTVTMQDSSRGGWYLNRETECTTVCSPSSTKHPIQNHIISKCVKINQEHMSQLKDVIHSACMNV